MSQKKILRLHPHRGMFMADGIHLVNPEKPVVYLPDSYEPTKNILNAISARILVDVNNNIVPGKEAKAAPVEPPVVPPVVEPEAPVAPVESDVPVEPQTEVEPVAEVAPEVEVKTEETTQKKRQR